MRGGILVFLFLGGKGWGKGEVVVVVVVRVEGGRWMMGDCGECWCGLCRWVLTRMDAVMVEEDDDESDTLWMSEWSAE